MDDDLSIPDLPESLTPDQLWAVYLETDPSRAAALGLKETSADEWPRVRKYAYARYWQARLASRSPIDDRDVEAWREAAKADFLRNVALGIMGDAARANLLSRAQIDRLLGDELNPYAQRALSARRVLMDRNAVDAALIDALLNERAAWALHELLSRDDLDAAARSAITSAAADARLSRIERHALREALRRKPNAS